MTKIVYTSDAGSTKRYAEMLGKKTGFKVVPLEKAKLDQSEDMIYLGWVMMGELQGYKEAKQLGKIKAVVAVGMMDTEDNHQKITKSHSIEEPFFFVMGALEKKDFIQKLEKMLERKLKEETDNPLLNSPMMSMMLKPMVNMAIKKFLSEFKDGDEKNQQIYKLIEDGFDYVSEENLTDVLNFING